MQTVAGKRYTGDECVDISRKKLHGRELIEDKNYNRDISSARAAIENINQSLKPYAILDDVNGGAIDKFKYGDKDRRNHFCSKKFGLK